MRLETIVLRGPSCFRKGVNDCLERGAGAWWRWVVFQHDARFSSLGWAWRPLCLGAKVGERGLLGGSGGGAGTTRLPKWKSPGL